MMAPLRWVHLSDIHKLRAKDHPLFLSIEKSITDDGAVSLGENSTYEPNLEKRSPKGLRLSIPGASAR